MKRTFITNFIYSLLVVLLLCPITDALSQEPAGGNEENTLGDGLKAIQEAEGRIVPETEIIPEQGNPENIENDAADQVPDTPTNVQGSDNGNNIEMPLAENPNEENPPRGDQLRARQMPRYDSTGMRDPFRPFLKLIDIPKGPDPIVRPPLTRYPLGSFRLAGIVWIGDQPKAMIVDPEANTYFLGVGDGIGNKEGVILEVRERGILVQEQTKFENVYGEVRTETKKSVLAFQN